MSMGEGGDDPQRPEPDHAPVEVGVPARELTKFTVWSHYLMGG